MVEHENKLNQLEEEKVQPRNEMVQKTTLIFFQLDRQKQYIRRKNILIYGVGEDKEDNNDGEKVLFKICSNPPAIIALLETRIKETSIIATLPGYNSQTQAGGVGAFIKKI